MIPRHRLYCVWVQARALHAARRPPDVLPREMVRHLFLWGLGVEWEANQRRGSHA